MKIRSKVGIGLLSTAMCIAALAHAQDYERGSAPQVVEFKTTAAKGSIHIKGSVPGLAVAHSEGDFIVLKADLNKMVMGEADDQGTMDKQRADHAKKELRVGAHPMAELKVKKSSVKPGGKKGVGTFTLAGKPREIEFDYSAKDTGKEVKVTGSFPISLKAHGIKEICLSVTGVCVADAVSVNAAFSLKKTASE
jgi:polyisoprenoid-binding protein YceI